MEYDGLLRLLGGAMFTVSVAVSAGIASITLLGQDFSTVLWESGGGTFAVDISTAISILLIGFVSAVSMPSFSDMRPEYQLAVLVTLIVIVFGAYDPGFAASNNLLGLGAVAVTGAAYWGIQTGDCY